MCVAFAMMPQCESARTAFDMLYALYPEPASLISYDNGWVNLSRARD